jgi:hypothetical protein
MIKGNKVKRSGNGAVAQAVDSLSHHCQIMKEAVSAQNSRNSNSRFDE